MSARTILTAAFLFSAIAAPALAQADTAAAELRASGAIGEQATGYMAPAPGAQPSDAQERAMEQINIQRRTFYTQKAAATNSTVSQFGQFTACEIFKRLKPGEAYRDESNAWGKAGAGGAPLPSWCGK